MSINAEQFEALFINVGEDIEKIFDKYKNHDQIHFLYSMMFLMFEESLSKGVPLEEIEFINTSAAQTAIHDHKTTRNK